MRGGLQRKVYWITLASYFLILPGGNLHKHAVYEFQRIQELDVPGCSGLLLEDTAKCFVELFNL